MSHDFYCEQVLSGKTDIQKIYEDKRVLAFHHTKPSWTTHVVVIPKEHVPNLHGCVDGELLKQLLRVIQKIILDLKLDDTNYKVVTNGGEFQDSKHLHFHILSGSSI